MVDTVVVVDRDILPDNVDDAVNRAERESNEVCVTDKEAVIVGVIVTIDETVLMAELELMKLKEPVAQLVADNDGEITDEEDTVLVATALAETEIELPLLEGESEAVADAEEESERLKEFNPVDVAVTVCEVDNVGDTVPLLLFLFDAVSERDGKLVAVDDTVTSAFDAEILAEAVGEGERVDVTVESSDSEDVPDTLREILADAEAVSDNSAVEVREDFIVTDHVADTVDVTVRVTFDEAVFKTLKEGEIDEEVETVVEREATNDMDAPFDSVVIVDDVGEEDANGVAVVVEDAVPKKPEAVIVKVGTVEYVPLADGDEL